MLQKAQNRGNWPESIYDMPTLDRAVLSIGPGSRTSPCFILFGWPFVSFHQIELIMVERLSFADKQASKHAHINTRGLNTQPSRLFLVEILTFIASLACHAVLNPRSLKCVCSFSLQVNAGVARCYVITFSSIRKVILFEYINPQSL